MDSAPVKESSFAIVVALCAAAFTSAAAWTGLCSAQYSCERDGTCSAFVDEMGSCSYANVVGPAGLHAFNLSLSSDTALAALTRGVCAAGERQTLNSHGHLVCVRAPSYPMAFNAEAGDPTAATDHERACGRWINSKSSSRTTELFSFYDERRVTEEVVEQVRAETTGVEIDDVTRFRGACERMVVNAAMAPAAENAFDYLQGLMGAETTSVDEALRQIGVLTAHYCDAPVAIGVGIDGESFSVAAVDGVGLSQDTATDTLYSFGVHSEIREKAREFVAEMRSAPASLLSATTPAQLDAIVVGAIGNSWLSDSVQIRETFDVKQAEHLHTLERFLYAVAETSPTHAHAYLTACAARCALAARSVISGEFGANVHRGRRAVGLGQLEPLPADLFSQVDDSVIVTASTMGWSTLSSSRALSGVSATDASDACWRAATVAFPDQLDGHVFDRLTTPRLVDRLPPMVALLKESVTVELLSGRTSRLIADPVERARISAAAGAAVFKIAGSQRGSPYGRAGEFQRPAFRSDDGALMMLTKQGNAVFLDRLQLAIDYASSCEHPVVFPAVARNAYLLTTHPCSYLLPGLLVPPFASERYDDASLYARIGFVVAHEACHVASRVELWDSDFAGQLLANYTGSTQIEAAADLCAAAAVLATGKVSVDELAGAVSQMWCGRGRVEGGVSHPRFNLRGDNVCHFIKSF